VTESPADGGTVSTSASDRPAGEVAGEPSAIAVPVLADREDVPWPYLAGQKAGDPSISEQAGPEQAGPEQATSEQAAPRSAAAEPGAADDTPAKRKSWRGIWRGRFGWLGSPWVAAAAFVVTGVLLFIGYLAQARTMGIHLDASSASGPQTLQAWDMLHGNPLLRGWQVGDVSYYTTELPEYAFVEWILGLSGDVVHVAAALTYTIMVLLAGLLAKGRATGREGLVRFLIAIGIMLAPAFLTGTSVLLSGPDHTGIQVPLLLIWLAVDRLPARWWAPLVITVLVTWALIADNLVLAEAVLPLVMVCLFRMNQRRGPLAGQWYDLSLAAGAGLSVFLAKHIYSLIQHSGGYSIRAAVISVTPASDLTTQFWTKAERVLAIFSADFFGQPLGRWEIGPLVHLVGFGLAAWAVVAGLRRFASRDLAEQVLIVAFVVLLVAYLIGTRPDPNEMVGLLPIGAVLAGRLLGGRILRAKLVPALTVILLWNAVLLGQDASQPAASTQSLPPAAWFEARHLTSGLSGFEEAYSVSVSSGDRVHISPVRLYNQMVVTTPWENDASWFDPRTHYANFVLQPPPNSCGNSCRAIVDLFRDFGSPAKSYLVDGYRVLVWDHNLLPELPTYSWCAGGWAWIAQGTPSATPCK
jgi:hypothetical protein